MDGNEDVIFEMDNWMMHQACRRFTVAGTPHIICETGRVGPHAYAEFFFEKGRWFFLRTLVALPPKEVLDLYNAKR